MNVIAVQLDIAWENKPANFKKVSKLLAQAAPKKDSLVVLPEMFATGFSMNTAAIAEPYGGETEQFLANTAREFGVYVLGGAAMKGRDGRPRNKAVAFSPAGELIGSYGKMRPFTPGGENQHYVAGERTAIVQWGDCKVAPLVCYDLRFPELFRATTSVHRPELFAVISSWPGKRIARWLRLVQARAIENQAYVVAVNRVGKDPFYDYPGRSVIADFNGEFLADAGAGEGCAQASLDLETLREYRQGLPFLEDMKPGAQA